MKTIVILLTLCGEPTGVVMKIDGQWLVGTPQAAIQAYLPQLQEAEECVRDHHRR